jgi:pyruvate formate lyase activating enzyme
MGCPLRCKWCQNPENLVGKPVVLFDENKCVKCGECIRCCEYQANSIDETGRIKFQSEKCTACGKCADACLYDARSLCGKALTVDEVFSEVMKDEVFFRNTGGGVTLSGGECTIYPEFTKKLLSKFKECGIHTAIETCGYCKRQSFEIIKDSVDLFLYDFKLYTAQLHEKWTGKNNNLIMENLEYLSSINKHIVIRIPLIEGINDKEEFHRMMKYLKKLPQLKEIHIMPFHQIGSSKYTSLGMDYEMSKWKECSLLEAEKCKKIAEDYGFLVNIGGWDLQ